ncbi:hypothetical protein OROHE_022282 [Orobanche hederae]
MTSGIVFDRDVRAASPILLLGRSHGWKAMGSGA